MRLRAGGALWLLRHELRTFLRGVLLQRTQAGQKAPGVRKAILLWGALGLMMHAAAWAILSATEAAAAPPQEVLMLASGAMLVALTMMLSTGLRSSVEALFERGDLDLLLSSPLSSRSIFTVRLGAIVIGSAGLYLFFLAPLAHVGLVMGRWRWLGIYPTIISMAIVTSSLAMLMTLALVRWLGVRRTRVTAQILGALAGALVFLVSQSGTLGGGHEQLGERLKPLLAHGALLGPDSLAWLPGRAMLGEPGPILLIAALGALAFALTVHTTHGFFVHGVQQAASKVAARAAPAGGLRFHFGRSLFMALLVKEWRLILRDPQLISQVLLQLLYMLPLALVLFTDKAPSLAGVAAAMAFLCGSLTGSLAWIIIAAEDAPDLLRASPASQDTLKIAKLAAAVLPTLALVLPPLAWLALRAPLAAAAMLLMAAVAGANNALVVKWCSRPALRGDFRQRGKGNALGIMFELLGGMCWAGTAFALVYALTGSGRSWFALLGACGGALVALVVLGVARHFRPVDD